MRVLVLNKTTRQGVEAAKVTIVTQNPLGVTIIRSVTLVTLTDGVVEDQRFLNEEVQVSVRAKGWLGKTKQLRVACEDGDCSDCVFEVMMDMTKLAPNTTFCPDIEANIMFLDSVTTQVLPHVSFDVFLLPLTCNIHIQNITQHVSTNSDSFTTTQIENTTGCNTILIGQNFRSSVKGQSHFKVVSSGRYLVTNIGHPTHLPALPGVVEEVDCGVPAMCHHCRLAMALNLTRPACSSAVMHIHVRDQEEDKPVVGAHVEVFLEDTIQNVGTVMTSKSGSARLEVADQTTYSVLVSAEGKESVQLRAATECDLRHCTDCSTLVKFALPSATKNPTCPDTTLSLTVQGLSSRVTITLTYSTSGAPPWILLADKVPTLENHVIHQNGFYRSLLSTPGHISASKNFHFNCSTSDCANCSQNYAFNLPNNFCEETYFDIVLSFDGEPLEDVQVTLQQPPPSLAIVDSQQTSPDGKVSFPLAGSASFLVNITKEGYATWCRGVQVFCDVELPCPACLPRLELQMVEHVCNRTVTISVQVNDPEKRPIEGAQVKITLKKSQVGYIQPVFENLIWKESNLTTNSSGIVEEVIPQFGIYSIEVMVPGFLPATRDVEIMKCWPAKPGSPAYGLLREDEWRSPEGYTVSWAREV